MKLSALVHSLRPLQWTKNIFVLAPLLFSFKVTDEPSLYSAMFATFAFCLLASALYIINDLIDLESDRRHPHKSRRPLAAGAISVGQAMGLIAVLVALAALVLFYGGFDQTFWIFLGLYLCLSLSYSFHLKQVPLLELFLVASGYMLRLLAGSAAISELPGPWMLATAGCLSLLIVAGARRTEIATHQEIEHPRLSLRSYNLTFLDSTITMLAALTVATYLGFCVSDYAIARYGTPYFVGTAVFVVFGVLRYLQIVKVTQTMNDPTAFVFTDLGICLAAAGWLAACGTLIYFH